MPITIDHVTLLVAQQQKLLQDITCQIADAQITLLLGKTGAGKSTLLNAMAGLSEIQEGSILYDEVSLWQGKRLHASVQFSLGSVFQYPEQQLFARTVREEFLYSLRYLKLKSAQAQERMLQAMEDIGLAPALLEESPLTLSTGQKRRVALASTLATRPRWLFLDEPTAGLDADAVQRFVHYLLSWKRTMGGGIVIATHDMDALLPVADTTIVLKDGCLVFQGSPQELCLHPAILLDAEIGIPVSIDLSSALRRWDDAVPGTLLSPAQYAEHVLKLHQQTLQRPGQDQPPWLDEQDTEVARDLSQRESREPPTLVADPRSFPEETTFVALLDPRSRWLFYVLVSLGIFVQHSLIGLLFGSLITLCCVLVTRVSLRPMLPVLRPFFILTLLSVLLSGIQFHQVTPWYAGLLSFVWQPALLTFMQLYKIILVVILGILLSTTTSQLKMKRGLEQSLAFLRVLKLPVEAFSLGASLVLHFVPVIMQEAARFARITRARGKRQARKGTIGIRDLTALIIPLVIAILQLGSDLTLAMEARGYTRMGLPRTASFELKLRKADLWTMALGVVTIGIFLVLGYSGLV